MRSSVHIVNKGKDILFLDKGQTQGLDNTTLSAEAQNSINFTRSNIKFCLSLHYNGSNSFLFANATKIYQFKAKDSEIKVYPLCLGNISGDSTNNMKKTKQSKTTTTTKKTGLNECVCDVAAADYRAFDNSNIINIYKYLMKKHYIK